MAALGSWVDARNQGGEWLLRIEDLDRPRVKPGARDTILRQLEWLGLTWDGQILEQRSRTQAYRKALEQLVERDLVYPCSCSRSEIASLYPSGTDGHIYGGRCRNGPVDANRGCAIRLRCDDDPINFVDLVHGSITQRVFSSVGDFVLRRTDGIHSYQLAVVVDDAWQGITHVVRGCDLLLSTPRQILLQRHLGYPTPEYLHLPLARDTSGKKLSKSDQAPATDSRTTAIDWLLRAWDFLGQSNPPEDMKGGDDPHRFLEWAMVSWARTRIPSDGA